MTSRKLEAVLAAAVIVTQVKPNTYVGAYTDAKGQKWNFTVELISSENDSYIRPVFRADETEDRRWVRQNERIEDSAGNGTDGLRES